MPSQNTENTNAVYRNIYYVQKVVNGVCTH